MKINGKSTIQLFNSDGEFDIAHRKRSDDAKIVEEEEK